MRRFSSRSMKRLEGVKSPLVKVTERALQLSPHDFGITEGVRSIDTQAEYVRLGKSQTMKSRHLTGHAVDVVAYVNGGYTYEPFRLYTDIAEGFRQAAIELEVEVLWGASWLMALNHYDSAQDALNDYVSTRRSQNRRVFLDGPHFQLTWRKYP